MHMLIYIFGFGILWSGLSVKSFLAFVPVQNGGRRASSKNSLCQKKKRGCHTVYFQIGFGSIGQRGIEPQDQKNPESPSRSDLKTRPSAPSRRQHWPISSTFLAPCLTGFGGGCGLLSRSSSREVRRRVPIFL